MARRLRSDLVPSLILAAGMILAALAAVFGSGSGWLVMTGPAMLALSVLAADATARRLREGALRISPAAWILCASLLLAGGLLAGSDPKMVGTMMPVLGAAAWPALLDRRQTCGARPE